MTFAPRFSKVLAITAVLAAMPVAACATSESSTSNGSTAEAGAGDERAPESDGGAQKDSGAAATDSGTDTAATPEAGEKHEASVAECPIESDPACKTCIQSSCCDELAACLNEPDCVAINDCQKACDSQPCRDACYSQHTTGAPLGHAFVDCYNGHCQAACQ